MGEEQCYNLQNHFACLVPWNVMGEMVSWWKWSSRTHST